MNLVTFSEGLHHSFLSLPFSYSLPPHRSFLGDFTFRLLDFSLIFLCVLVIV